ncbi:hypothetical protein AMTR_s00003p00245190 [Amborella trichopoda]|uniref:Pentatricopeptide repeat-containing protein n=1 Tax=Amborella trichopoda TaxID=13333 RepID=W1P616_AMBTC|nr:hypothetical protein AMTR_s00003p00245190 [Amborella trichopoda]
MPFSLSSLDQPNEALVLFACMHRSGCKPDNYTFHPVLKACTALSSLDLGKMAHNLVAILGHGSDEGVSKSLLDLYAKCGASSEAPCLFQEKALTFMHKMHESEEMPMPNAITLAVVFTACAKLNALLSSRGLHGYAIKMGFESWTLVANAILLMYSKCQKVLDACSDQAPNYATIATVLSISAELEGQCAEGEKVHCYVEIGWLSKAVEFFRGLLCDGMNP